MGRVSRDITTFVITVNGEISSDEFLDNSVVVSHHVSVVSSPIKFGIAIN